MQPYVIPSLTRCTTVDLAVSHERFLGIRSGKVCEKLIINWGVELTIAFQGNMSSRFEWRDELEADGLN
jgi:hypothetical protein